METEVIEKLEEVQFSFLIDYSRWSVEESWIDLHSGVEVCV